MPGDAGTGPDDAADATVDMMPVDLDGDGLVGDDDNCPTVANADQRDHDQDGFGDACDRCPHLPSDTDPDTDDDGVGDDCDPRPEVPGDSIALWEGFYDGEGITDWLFAGTWLVVDGMLTQTSTTTALAYAAPPVTFVVERAVVTSTIQVDAFGTPAGQVSPGIALLAGSVGNSQGYYCSLTTAATQLFSLGFWVDPATPQNDAAAAADTWTGTFAPGSRIRLVDSLAGDVHACTAVEDTTTLTVTSAYGSIAGDVALVTALAAASFDYIFVVSVGP